MTIGRSGNPAATSCRASWFGGAMSRSRGVGAAFDCRLGYPDASLALKLPRTRADWFGVREARSEEHTSELQSHLNIVCRLLLEKKKNQHRNSTLLRKQVKHELL